MTGDERLGTKTYASNERLWVRDRIVGSTRRGSSVVSTMSAPAGGSSSSFSVALAASGLDS